MQTFNYAKNKSLDIDSTIIAGIRKAHKVMQRAESAYIARNEELAEAMQDLVIQCKEAGLKRAEGGKILAAICGIEHLKTDKALSNAWQYAASDLPSRQKEPTMPQDDTGDTGGTSDTNDTAQPSITLEALIADNQIVGLTDALIALLTGDQVDVLAKKLSDHINARQTAKLPKQRKATQARQTKQGDLLAS